MSKSLARLCTILLASLAFISTGAIVENGGYSVFVSFSQNVPSEDGKVMLENMKDTLEDASKILHNATGLQFSKVTFEIPRSWDTSEWNITIEDSFKSRSSKTDFLVDNANDVVFGKFPFAQQYGSCSVPGHQIIVPKDFFDEANKFPKGISMAREWLKYRYGVFDENGYFSDPLYPLYYTTPGRDPNEVKITECTNAQVTYKFIDQKGDNCSESDKTLTKQLNSGECKIHVDEENLENVTSSFMYFQENIVNMQHICGRDPDHQHNSRSPNKQNALCFGQSIWQIVKMSSDFRSDEINEEYADIKYVYVQETKPKVVVAWENTVNLKNKESAILNAIHKFIIDLPEGSRFNAFPFKSNVPDKDYALEDLNGWDVKKSMISEVSSDFVINENGNINAAIHKAVDILSANSPEVESTIIIIARSNETLDENSVLDKLADSNICVKIVLFSEEDISEETKTYTTDFSCPAIHVQEFSMSDTNEETFEKLFEVMETLLPSKMEDKAIETVKTAVLSEKSPIAFQVDDSAETVTFWVFSKRESDNFNLKLNGEEKKAAITSETFGNIVALSYSPTQPGNIEFEYPHDAQPMLTQVRITSKAGKYFNGEILVHDTTRGSTTDQMPVIIYVIIRYGAYPVQNAKVSSTIRTPTGNEVELELNDDGKGDPDITQNDGVYSRYFTSFTGEGEYTVTVTVKNNEYMTTYGADKNTGYQTCCGSYVNGDTSKLKEFSKVLRTTFRGRGSRPVDGYKPSRISDLRIDEVTDDKIILKWSAPGGEADSGTAQSYEIKRFTSQEEAMKNFDNGNALFNYSASPKESGETETFEISFDDFEESGLYYIAMKAKSNKTSDLSNTIEVFILDQKTTDDPDGGTDEPGIDNTKAGSTNPRTIKIIVGVIVGVMLLVIILYLIVYFFVVKPKRKKDVKDNPIYETATRVENTTLNPINFIPADTLIKHHNEKAKAKIENKEPPIFKEEDFEDRNSLPASETAVSNNQQTLESSSKASSNEQPMPPKSPKRTTYV